MATLIEQMLLKMGLRDEPNMQSKTLELLRLLELRSTNVPLQLNEYAKTIICTDIATRMVGGIAFDVEQAIKLSNLRKSHYTRHKRMIEKLLDLNKIVGVNDICVQLNLTEVTQKANELLEFYKTVMTHETAGGGDESDLIHPQYAAMAVWQAAKMLKQKVSKQKLLSFSNLRPTQWQQLELRWSKSLSKHNEAADKKLKTRVVELCEDVESAAAAGTKFKTAMESNKRSANTMEDYDNWKKRMLQMAEEKLKSQCQMEQETDENELDKENFILGL